MQKPLKKKGNDFKYYKRKKNPLKKTIKTMDIKRNKGKPLKRIEYMLA